MPRLNLDTALRAAEQAADAAAEAIRPFFRSLLSIERKDDNTPVTAADRLAEQAIRAVLETYFPGCGILGEEFGALRPNSALTWVIDPIDGTKSFLTGRPTYGTLIALLVDDIPTLGLMNQPSTRERWVALRDRPTLFFSPLGGPAVARCRRCDTLARAQLSVTTLDQFTSATRLRWERLAAHVGQVTWGGDCYSYGLLALGLVDLIAEASYKIWDWAALVPIIESAGGVITDWAGRPLRPGADGSVLAAGDPAIHAAAREILNDA